MDENPDQIIEEIETQRNRLGANLNELETRVRQTTDWRTHYDRNPMLMLSAALGGGILLGAMVSGGKSKSSSSYSSSPSSSSKSSSYGAYSASGAYSAPASSPAVAHQKQRASETIDHIKAALIGFATSKAKEFLNQALPGFDQHLSEVESKKGQHAYDTYTSGSQSSAQPSEFPSGGSYGQSGQSGQTQSSPQQSPGSTYTNPS